MYIHYVTVLIGRVMGLVRPSVSLTVQ